jgi:hypothetical protein
VFTIGEQCDVPLFETHPMYAEVTEKYSKFSGLTFFHKGGEDI